MDNMACHFELLDRDFTVPWEEKDIPIVVTHLAADYGVGRVLVGLFVLVNCRPFVVSWRCRHWDYHVPMAMPLDLKALRRISISVGIISAAPRTSYRRGRRAGG